MLRYLIRRMLYAVPILLGVTLITFFLFFVAIPKDEMARRQLGKNPTPQQIQLWLTTRGYDRPILQQFGSQVGSLFTFQFGNSDVTNEPIWNRITEGAPVSAKLGTLVLIASTISTIAFALFLAYYRGTYIDGAGTVISVILMSVVYTVYILITQYTVGRILKWFPLAGWRGGLSSWQFLLLPMLVGVISGLGASVRFYRTVMLDEMNLDYVRTARAKGVSESEILFKHVLKNAAIPIVTSTIMSIPFLILGSLLLESFFGIPGLGGITVDAINNQDFATVRAIVFLGSVLYIVGSILTDICYALVDPRVRLD